MKSPQSCCCDEAPECVRDWTATIEIDTDPLDEDCEKDEFITCERECKELCHEDGGFPFLPDCEGSPWFDECFVHPACPVPPPECACALEIMQDLGDSGDPACVGEVRGYNTSGCPSVCEDECDANDWQWTVWFAEVVKIIGPDNTPFIDVEFIGFGTAIIAVSNDCCEGDMFQVEVACCVTGLCEFGHPDYWDPSTCVVFPESTSDCEQFFFGCLCNSMVLTRWHLFKAVARVLNPFAESGRSSAMAGDS